MVIETAKMADRVLAFKSLAEFEEDVPTLARLPVTACQAICSKMGCEFHHFPYVDPLFQTRLRRLYQSRNSEAMATDAFGCNGAALPGDDTFGSLVWTRSFFGKYVTPGVFFHELGHVFHAAEIGGSDSFYRLAAVLNKVWGPKPFRDLFEAVAGGYAIAIAHTACRFEWCSPEHYAGVLEQVISDGYVGPFSRELGGFLAAKSHLLRSGQEPYAIDPENPLSAVRAFGQALMDHLFGMSMSLGLPPVPRDDRGGFSEAHAAYLQQMADEMLADLEDDGEVNCGGDFCEIGEWAASLPASAGVDPETGCVKDMGRLMAYYSSNPEEPSPSFVDLLAEVWDWVKRPRNKRTQNVWEDPGVSGFIEDFLADPEASSFPCLLCQAQRAVPQQKRFVQAMESLVEFLSEEMDLL